MADAVIVRSEFDVHLLNDQGRLKAVRIAVEFSKLLAFAESMVPKSRELSIVITHLQEACFWVKRGMAIDPVNQLQDEQK